MARHCGFIAIVGRPNVGKSTLLNRMLGQKVSITSRKPQTTRYRILGVDTVDETQLIFVDTPGWQRQPRSEINRLMNRQVRQALFDVDCAVQVIDARGWHADDDLVYAMLKEARLPALLAMNKHDLVKSKPDLLPRIAALADSKPFEAFVPVCAKNGEGLEELRRIITEFAPAREHLFPGDQVTDRSERFLAGEIIREKSMRYLGDELPYRTTVIIDEFRAGEDITYVHATIWVDRDSQKSIVIGKKGALLKRISTDARHELEDLLGRKVYLKIWVKTKRGWIDNPEALQLIGLAD
jgi:GTPase